jgi:hypothetical protein
MEAGRDLRPDTITPSPDITSSGVAALETVEEAAAEILAADEEFVSEAEATADETETTAPAVSEDAASGGSTDEEKH